MFVGLLRKSAGSSTATEATPRMRKNVSPHINKKLEDLVRRINVFLLPISVSRGCFHNRDVRSICHCVIAVPHWSCRVERPAEELNASARPNRPTICVHLATSRHNPQSTV